MELSSILRRSLKNFNNGILRSTIYFGAEYFMSEMQCSPLQVALLSDTMVISMNEGRRSQLLQDDLDFFTYWLN